MFPRSRSFCRHSTMLGWRVPSTLLCFAEKLVLRSMTLQTADWMVFSAAQICVTSLYDCKGRGESERCARERQPRDFQRSSDRQSLHQGASCLPCTLCRCNRSSACQHHLIRSEHCAHVVVGVSKLSPSCAFDMERVMSSAKHQRSRLERPLVTAICEDQSVRVVFSKRCSVMQRARRSVKRQVKLGNWTVNGSVFF